MIAFAQLEATRRAAHVTSSGWSWLVLLAAALLTAPCSAHAQVDAACDPVAPPWSRSLALGPHSDLGMPAPTVVALPSVNVKRRVDLVSTAANAAALADQVDTATMELGATLTGVSGAYRRPLDVRGSRAVGARFAGTTRISPTTAISGGGAIVNESISSGTRTLFVAPYSSNPFVPSDTNAPAFSRPSVCMYGSEGSTLGRWQLGVATAYRALDNATANSGIAALGRATSGGISAGIARILTAAARVGFVVRQAWKTQTVSAISNPAAFRVYALNGYESVAPQDYTAASPESFFRRQDGSGTAAGLDGAATLRGIALAGYWEWQTRSESQFATLSSNPRTDRWKTRGNAVGGGAHHDVLGFATSVDAGFLRYSGSAVRSDTTSRPYRSNASRLVLALDVRRAFLDSAWTGSLVLNVMRWHQNVQDDAVRAETDIASWQPGIGLEIAHRLSDNRALTFGAGMASYASVARLPDPTARGRAYDMLIAPAIEIAAAPASIRQLSFGWSAQLLGRRFSVRGEYSSLQSTRAFDPEIPLPTGIREQYAVLTSIATHR